MVSPAGTPPAAALKYALGLVMINDHLLFPNDVATGAVVLPQVVDTYFQSPDEVLKFVITPRCI